MKLRHPTSLCRPHDKNSKKSATIVFPLSSLGNASFWNIFPRLIKDERLIDKFNQIQNDGRLREEGNILDGMAGITVDHF